MCYGNEGEGQKLDIPALAGQQTDYLTATLKAFKEGSRHNDVYGKMRSISKTLTDKEIEELWGHFFALKTDEAIQSYRKDHEPHIVGSEFVAWKHHLTGKPEKDNIMVSLGSGVSINGFIARIVG